MIPRRPSKIIAADGSSELRSEPTNESVWVASPPIDFGRTSTRAVSAPSEGTVTEAPGVAVAGGPSVGATDGAVEGVTLGTPADAGGIELVEPAHAARALAMIRPLPTRSHPRVRLGIRSWSSGRRLDGLMAVDPDPPILRATASR